MLIFHNESGCPDARTFFPAWFPEDGQINPTVKDTELLLCSGRYNFLPTMPNHMSIDIFKDLSLKALRITPHILTVDRTFTAFDISQCLNDDGNPTIPDVRHVFGDNCASPLWMKLNQWAVFHSGV